MTISDVVGYQNAYDSFLEYCGDPEANGLGTKYAANPRTIDIMSLVVFLTTDPVANSQQKALFAKPPDAYLQRKTLLTQSPQFNNNGQVPNNSIYAIYAAFALYDHELGTEAQALNARRILSAANAQVDISGQMGLSWHMSRVLNSLAAYSISNDSTATIVRRSKIENVDFTPLPAPKILVPGTTLSGQLTFDIATAFGVETPLIFALHCFAVDAGEN